MIPIILTGIGMLLILAGAFGVVLYGLTGLELTAVGLCFCFVGLMTIGRTKLVR